VPILGAVLRQFLRDTQVYSIIHAHGPISPFCGLREFYANGTVPRTSGGSQQ